MLEDLLKDILKEENVLMTANVSGGAVMEMRIHPDLPFKSSDEWITIGDNAGPCHMHINKSEVKEIRFLKEPKENRTSYSIRFMNSNGDRLLAAFFTKMQDNDGNPIQEKIERYENIFKKYGSRETIKLA